MSQYRQMSPTEPSDAPEDLVSAYLDTVGPHWLSRATEATLDAQVAAFRAGWKAGYKARQGGAELAE